MLKPRSCLSILTSLIFLGAISSAGSAQQVNGQAKPLPPNILPPGQHKVQHPNQVQQVQQQPIVQQQQQQQNRPIFPINPVVQQPQFKPYNPVFAPSQFKPQVAIKQPVVQQPITPILIVPNVLNTYIPPTQYQNYVPLPNYAANPYYSNNYSNNNPYAYNSYANPYAYNNTYNNPYLSTPYTNPYAYNTNPYNSNLTNLGLQANQVQALNAIQNQNLLASQNQWTNQLNPVSNPWLSQSLFSNPFTSGLYQVPATNNGLNNGVFMVNGVNVNSPALAGSYFSLSQLPLSTRIALGIY